MPVIDLVPFYLGDRRRLLAGLTTRLAGTFDAEVRLRPPWFDPEHAFAADRGQYRSTGILEQLLGDPRRAAAAAGDRLLAVTGVDLFIPVLTYVFGEAQLDGPAAVVSLHRLRAELYGLPADDLQLADRLAKEAVHELGHTYGLIHCSDPRCVMHASTYVEEIDLKPATPCAECLGRLRAATGGAG